MNGAPWKTPRAWSRSTLAAALASLLLLLTAACGGGGSGNGGTDRRDTGGSGGPDIVTSQDTGGPPADVPKDVPPADVPPADVPPADVPPADVPPPVDIPAVAPVITILEPAEGTAIRRAAADAPTVFRVRIEHPGGLALVEFGADGQSGMRQQFVPAAPSGEFTFSLADYYVPDGTPPAGPEEVQRRWPAEGPKTFYVGVVSATGTRSVARRTIYVDATPPRVSVVDAPADRGLQYLDVVGQIRLQFRASDTHALKETRVRITWDADGAAQEDARTLVPSRTNEYLVVAELGANVARARVTVEAEDAAGWVDKVELPVRIIKRPPYRLGHVFEFPGGVEVLGYAVGHYDAAADAYPDLFVATSDGLWLLLGADGGQFAGGFKLLDAPTASWQKVFLHDMDHDGLEDLFLVALDGSDLHATVAIREPAGDGRSIDDYIPYPDAAVVPNGSLSVALDDFNNDDWIDLAVGLADAEDSVAILLGSPFPEGVDLPMEVSDPLDPTVACDPACPTAPLRYTCSAGLCALEVRSDCSPACGAGQLCVFHAASESPRCVPLSPAQACGGCRAGERCVGAAGAETCRRVASDDCDPECAPSYTCALGECVLTRTDDCPLPCAPGETCHRGECVFWVGGECAPPCGDRQRCQFGTCVRLDDTCDPPCLAGQVCSAGQCRRLCDEEGCAPPPDYLPFFLRPNYLRGVAGITDLQTADFNADGRMDIVVGRTGVRQISCYIGLGDGDFLDAYDTYLDDDPFRVLPYWLTGSQEDRPPSGFIDLIVTTEANERFYLLRGDGTGFFDIVWMSDRNVAITDVATGTIFGQGDLVMLQPDASLLRTWAFQAGQPAVPARFSDAGAFSAGFVPGELALADMNLDGLLDVVYLNRGTSRLVVGLGIPRAGGAHSGDFDLPPEILMEFTATTSEPDATGDSKEGPADLVDIAVGRVQPYPSPSNDFADLVTMTHVPGPVDPIPIGLSAPEDCGEQVTVKPSRTVKLIAYRSDGVRPGRRSSYSDLPPVFGDAPVALALGKFDADGNQDVAVAIGREGGADEWTVAQACGECEEPEEGQAPQPCLPDPESTILVKVPNIAILRTTIVADPPPANDFHVEFVPYRNLDPSLLVSASVVALGFSTGAAPPEYLPASEEGQRGRQVPLGLLAADLSNDTFDDLIILSDQIGVPGDDDYAPPQLTTWRAPLNSNGIFDGPRFGATLGRAPRWWTWINADTVDTIPDLLIANMGDDDLTLLRAAGGQLRFLTPRYLATQRGPAGIAAANLDLDGDRVQDFIVAVDGNVQIGYSRLPIPPAVWAFDDVVFLYPGGTYPRDDPAGVQVADLNRDGLLDIVVSNQGSDTLTIFFGVQEEGRPHPLFPVYLDAPTGHEPAKLVMALDLPAAQDPQRLHRGFNGDGCPDFAVLNEASESVTLLLSIPELCR